MAKAFPFFRLPRELRDRIYAEVGGEVKQYRYSIDGPVKLPSLQDAGDSSSTPLKMSLRLFTSHKPSSHMLLVSRAFKTEYEEELRRHAVFCVSKLQESMASMKVPLLVEGSRAFRSLCSMSKLVMSYYGETNPCLREYEQIISTFSPWMEGLKGIGCIFLFHVPADQRDAEITCPGVLKTILERDDSLWPGDIAKVPIESRICIKSHQFCVNVPFQPTPAELERHPLLYEYLPDDKIRWLIEACGDNVILFNATPSSDEDAFWGLDLVSRLGSIVDLDGTIYQAGQRLYDEMEAADEDDEVHD